MTGGEQAGATVQDILINGHAFREGGLDAAGFLIELFLGGEILMDMRDEPAGGGGRERDDEHHPGNGIGEKPGTAARGRGFGRRYIPATGVLGRDGHGVNLIRKRPEGELRVAIRHGHDRMLHENGTPGNRKLFTVTNDRGPGLRTNG